MPFVGYVSRRVDFTPSHQSLACAHQSVPLRHLFTPGSRLGIMLRSRATHRSTPLNFYFPTMSVSLPFDSIANNLVWLHPPLLHYPRTVPLRSSSASSISIGRNHPPTNDTPLESPLDLLSNDIAESGYILHRVEFERLHRFAAPPSPLAARASSQNSISTRRSALATSNTPLESL